MVPFTQRRRVRLGENMSKTVRVIYIPVGSDPLVRDIEPTLDAMKALIGGGYIEYVGLTRHPGLSLVCDEEGKLKRLRPNMILVERDDVVAGDCFLIRTSDEGEAASVTRADIEALVGKGRIHAL
jgi:hypothetical protein